MTTQISDVQSTNRIPKSHLKLCFRIFGVLNFLPPPIMGKPNKLATGVLISALATSANAKDGEQLLAFNETRGDVPTQYESGPNQRKTETVAVDYEAQVAMLIAQIEMGKKTCPTLKKESKKEWRKCKKEQIAKPRLALLTLEETEQAQIEKEIDKNNSELTQGIKQKLNTKSELSQANQNLDKEDSQLATRVDVLRKENEDLDVQIAALKAIKKAAEEMEK